MEISLETRDLNIYYGKCHVVRDVNLKIQKNKITVILGPSGCGKTTLLKSLNRILELQDNIAIYGSIYLGGDDIMRSRCNLPDIRKKMGLILQKPCPLPLSIFDNIAYGLRIQGEKNKKKLHAAVVSSLEEVGLLEEVKDRLAHPAAQLSIGQQQRLCLARAIAIKPDILLCDEPTSALDPLSSQVVEQLLLKLKRNYTIVLVTHTLRQARRLADTIAFVYLGELVEEGTVDQIFSSPKDARTRSFVNGKMS